MRKEVNLFLTNIALCIEDKAYGNTVKTVKEI